MFHATRAFTAAGQLMPSLLLKMWDTAAYSFHVQTFFLIAGYVAFPKGGSLQVQIGRQASLYYAYMVWSFVSWLIATAMADYVNHPVHLDDLLWIPIVPIQHFWFLLPLMVGTFLLWLLRTRLALTLAFILCFALANTDGVILGIYQSVLYILLGALLRATGIKLRANIFAGLLGLAVLTVSAWYPVYGGISIPPTLQFLFNLCGCYAAYVAGSYAARTKSLGSILSHLGRRSLSIYLLHVIAASSVRIALMHIAPDLNLYLAVTLTVLGGVCLPLIADALAQGAGVAAPLGLRTFRVRWPANMRARRSSERSGVWIQGRVRKLFDS